jgi:uncharacterized protein (DUF885 family)
VEKQDSGRQARAGRRRAAVTSKGKPTQAAFMVRQLAIILCFFVLGCTTDARLAPQPIDIKTAAESQRLSQILENYFEEYLQLFPMFATSIGDHRFDDQYEIPISEENRGRQGALYLKYQGQLATIKRGWLERYDRLSFDVFHHTLTGKLAGLKFSQHLQPVRQLGSAPIEFPVTASGAGVHPFKTVQDYENFLKRIQGFQAWVETALANMRKGIDLGIVQPRVVIERTLPQLSAMILADPKQSLFYRPILELPAHFSASDKSRLARAYAEAIEQRVIPTYQKLRAFIQDEYLSKARATIAASDLPDGTAWYDHLVKIQTTTNLTADEIFDLGINEIARIKKEMEQLRAESGFQGGMDEYSRYLSKRALPGYASREGLISGYEKIRQQVAPRLARLFGRLPKASFEIRTIEEFRERSAPSQYQSASADGSRPGIFYANAAGISETPRRPSEPLYLHEAVPGHHFQISLQQEQQSLPRFRRFGSYTAFVEGWALYAESLGKELGLYTEPHQQFSRLGSELFRAARLVVDVGLHRKKWTRDQAIKFLMETAMAGERGAMAEVDRYIAWPGQALAYKIGQLKISAIRAKAEKALGSKFDIRAFHDELLKDGALPLDLLETKMDAWMAEQVR